MMATATERQRAAEVAQRFPGWIVWTARNGLPVATRAGNQRFVNDGVWAATLIADGWKQLEAELAEQAEYDAERAERAERM